ncbi:MAG: BON domain-containing protein [Coxiellaceae bacterium]|jgi:osmotically-inducible protein OsmY|nr:BON domain-containing protein [Coxiellaceae bacterium]
MIRVLIILVFSLTLYSCVPAAFLVVGTTTGAIASDHRNAKTILEDREITFKLRHHFDNNQLLYGKSHLSVTTFNHVVLLVGQISAPELRDQIEDVIKSNPMVKMLYNEVTIEKPTSNVIRTNDTWLTTKVKIALSTTTGLNFSNLKITTEKGIVYLMGLTTDKQADLAARKASTVSGVERVVKLFEYMS